ncbi:glycoside hydrolase N-terminal domain-containing protein [Bacteroidota bacterium]
MNYIKYFLPLLFILTACSDETKNNESQEALLWYTQPAEKWDDALPIGNGKIGAMVYGDPQTGHIQLNDDSMWPGDKGWGNPEGRPEDLNLFRKLLIEGRNVEADQLFVDKFSNKSVVRSHQTLGDLFLEFGHENITEYKRSLDLDNAIIEVSYRTNGQLVTKKMFASHPDQAIIIQLYTESEEGLNGQVRLSRPDDDGFPTVIVKTSGEHMLTMEGEVTQRKGSFRSQSDPILHGVKFSTNLLVNNKGGQVTPEEDKLLLKGVREATFYIVSNSSFYQEDYRSKNRDQLTAIENQRFEDLIENHREDYKQLYARVTLKLSDASKDMIPTDERLARIRAGEEDPAMEALLFQYGRYLLISSSRHGTNPANLQGLWNNHIQAPWNADYHMNINLQMNYWLADVTGIGELNNALFDYVDRLIENGKTTASEVFACRGAYIPHATDLWVPTWQRAATAYWGCSFGAGGWIVQHYWQHYAFTLDKTFLEHRAFPAIQEIAQFYSDWLIEDPRDGTLVAAPSTSPENRFINAKGEAVATCMGSAMDQQIVDEVFTNYIAACRILDIENTLLDTIRMQKTQLRPGFVIGSDGRVLEWDREYKEAEPGHRHMSHLYGFHPGVSVSSDKDPEIFAAVRKTLDYRLANGGAGTGWSRAWLINLSARLLDGEMAHEHIQLLLQKSIGDNLFDYHPPFQIDGNFGYTAGVAEMLLQSHETNIIRLLPALPDAWETGYVEGLRARGGIEVDMYWKEHKLTRAVLKPKHDMLVKVVYDGVEEELDLKAGEEKVLKMGYWGG